MLTNREKHWFGQKAEEKTMKPFSAHITPIIQHTKGSKVVLFCVYWEKWGNKIGQKSEEAPLQSLYGHRGTVMLYVQSKLG